MELLIAEFQSLPGTTDLRARGYEGPIFTLKATPPHGGADITIRVCLRAQCDQKVQSTACAILMDYARSKTYIALEMLCALVSSAHDGSPLQLEDLE